MVLTIDTREHEKERKRIESQFDSIGVEYFRAKLDVGDYMSLDNDYVSIDRKKNLLELIGNVTQQHDRFQRELLRAKKAGIKLIILIEEESINTLEDVFFWHNPRRDITDWKIVNGHPTKIPKYPKATEGSSLYKSLCTIHDNYGVEFRFCSPRDTGYTIYKLLGGGQNE